MQRRRACVKLQVDLLLNASYAAEAAARGLGQAVGVAGTTPKLDDVMAAAAAVYANRCR